MAELAEQIKLITKGLRVQALEIKPALTGLDHTAAQVAALEADNQRLREAQFSAVKTLKRMAQSWRKYAGGEYCQIYNTGMAQGLTQAADNVDDFVLDCLRPDIKTN